ncbi:MAG: hypothetical protein AAFV29_11830, partial [Myxococcota bacterium]
RHVVPADQPAPVQSSVPSPQANTTSEMQRPTLTLKRMSSVLEAPQTSDFIDEGSTPLVSNLGADDLPTVADMPPTGLTRPAWEEARAMVNEPVESALGDWPQPNTTDWRPTTDWHPTTQQQTSQLIPPAPTIPSGPGHVTDWRQAPQPIPVDTVPAPMLGASTQPLRPENSAPVTEPAGVPPLNATPIIAESSGATSPNSPPIITEPAGVPPLTPAADSQPLEVQATPDQPGSDEMTPAQTPITASGNRLPAQDDELESSQPNATETDDASRDFFAPAKSEVDIDWDVDRQPWLQRAPVVLLVAAVALFAFFVLFEKRTKTEDPKAQETVAAEWPVQPSSDSLAPSNPEAAKPIASESTPAAVNALETATPAEPLAVAKPIESAPSSEPIKASARLGAAGPDQPKAQPSAPDKPSQEEVLKLIQQGDRALKREAFSSARRAYRQALKADAENAAAYSGLAMVWVNLEKDSSARSTAWRALKLDRRQARAHLALALVYANEGENEKAVRYYKNFLRYQPSGKLADEVRRVLATMSP